MHVSSKHQDMSEQSKTSQSTRLGVDKVKPKEWFRYSFTDWHFYNDPKRKIVDVLLEHVVLPHVIPLTVHLRFFFPDKDHYELYLLFEFFWF